ncbi:MAG: DUF2156 domain-containing protein [Chloroflexota bacterium]|nr:DUF2156 domain-containing protein [Chloroflexota bacterium]
MLYTTEQFATDDQLEAKLVRYYGAHTLVFFGLSPENYHFLAPGGEGLVNYRLANNVAIVLGDPVCAPEACERVTRSFLDFCALHNWRVAFYQVYPDHLDTYRALKLKIFKMGEEAVLDPQTFTLNGSALANVRTSCRRAEREGVTIRWYEGDLPPEAMQQIEQLSNIWLESKAGKNASETGFSTGRLDELNDAAARADLLASIPSPSNAAQQTVPRLVTAVATTSSGQACAFTTFTPIYGSSTIDEPKSQAWGWTLDMMRRLPDAPPGVMELLLARAIERFRSRGAHILSLGLVAWSDTRQEMTSTQRQIVSFITDHLHLLESHSSLFKFKQKFHPRWESRYIVASGTLALPKIALAVFSARNYAGGGVMRLVK